METDQSVRQKRMASAGQIKDLVAAIPTNVPFDVVERCKSKPELTVAFRRGIYAVAEGKIFTPAMSFMTPRDCDDDTANQLERWRQTYKFYFDTDPNFSSLKIPFAQGKRTRLIIELQDIKIEQILKAHSAKGIKIWRWTDEDLDTLVNFNERTGLHAVRVLDGADSDEAWRNLPADFFREENLATETLNERLLHGLDFFSEKKEHLDQRTGTIGAGSRCVGGHVPHVDWHCGRVSVSGFDPGNHRDYWRVRRVVSV